MTSKKARSGFGLKATALTPCCKCGITVRTTKEFPCFATDFELAKEETLNRRTKWAETLKTKKCHECSKKPSQERSG